MKRTITCKKCNAQIFNMKADDGKIYQCDIEPVVYWKNSKGANTIITQNGEVIKCNLTGRQDTAYGIGHLVHCCPTPLDFSAERQ